MKVLEQDLYRDLFVCVMTDGSRDGTSETAET